MQEIVPNFYTLSGMIAGRVYLIKDADGLTLIDTSIAPSGKRIVKKIEAAGHKPSDLKRVLVTHAHPDHVGGLHAVIAATGAQVWASAQEAEVLQSKIPIARADRSKLPGLNKLFLPPVTWFKPPVTVDHVLTDGEVLPVMDGLTVVATPGHAPGHVSFWHPARKLLITGDTIFHLLNRLTLPLASLTADMDVNKQSLRKLANLNPEVVCFGHGQPITENAAAKLKALADRVGA